MNIPTKFLAALVLTTSLAGCATPGYYGNQYAYRGTVTGAAVGAAGGALLGYAADGGYGNGALLGGTLGALAGGAAGYYYDQRQRGPEYGAQPYYGGSRDHRRPRHSARYDQY